MINVWYEDSMECWIAEDRNGHFGCGDSPVAALDDLIKRLHQRIWYKSLNLIIWDFLLYNQVFNDRQLLTTYDQIGEIPIVDGTNLNDFTTTGMWQFTDPVETWQQWNYPGPYWGLLKVYHLKNYVVQIFISDIWEGPIYRRVLNLGNENDTKIPVGGWSEWFVQAPGLT